MGGGRERGVGRERETDRQRDRETETGRQYSDRQVQKAMLYLHTCFVTVKLIYSFQLTLPVKNIQEVVLGTF